MLWDEDDGAWDVIEVREYGDGGCVQILTQMVIGFGRAVVGFPCGRSMGERRE